MLTFNEIFDLQNSSELTGIPSKGPVSPENFSRMQELCDYIKNLTDKSGKPIISGARKTGFFRPHDESTIFYWYPPHLC